MFKAQLKLTKREQKGISDICMFTVKIYVMYWYQATSAICAPRLDDLAERGVALIEEYNKILTNNETQKQYLLLAVKQHRQRYPDANKKTLLG